MARTAFLGLHELERNKSFHCQHHRTTRNAVARNSRCSLNLPLSRALPLFQLGFGGSLTSFPLLPNDSSQMPSLSPSTMSFSSSVLSFHQLERSLLHHEDPLLHRAKGAWRHSSHPWPGGMKPKPAPPLTSTAGPKLKTHGAHFWLCWFLKHYQDN